MSAYSKCPGCKTRIYLELGEITQCFDKFGCLVVTCDIDLGGCGIVHGVARDGSPHFLTKAEREFINRPDVRPVVEAELVKTRREYWG